MALHTNKKSPAGALFVCVMGNSAELLVVFPHSVIPPLQLHYNTLEFLLLWISCPL